MRIHLAVVGPPVSRSVHSIQVGAIKKKKTKTYVMYTNILLLVLFLYKAVCFHIINSLIIITNFVLHVATYIFCMFTFPEQMSDTLVCRQTRRTTDGEQHCRPIRSHFGLKKSARTIIIRKVRMARARDTCVICVEEVQAGFKLHCGHQYHVGCFLPHYVENKGACPTCREEMSPGDIQRIQCLICTGGYIQQYIELRAKQERDREAEVQRRSNPGPTAQATMPAIWHQYFPDFFFLLRVNRCRFRRPCAYALIAPSTRHRRRFHRASFSDDSIGTLPHQICKH